MKRIIKLLIIIIFLLIIFYVLYKLTTPSTYTYLFHNANYKEIDENNIVNIEVSKYTEGGLDSYVVTDKEELDNLYSYLSNIKIGEETDMACDDNTTIYTINLNDNSNKKVEIECDWIIINNKRYIIK